MYITAHGRAMPCCIAPFSMRGYDSFTLGDATQQTLARDLERRPIPGIPRRPAQRRAAASLRRLRAALEPVSGRGARRASPLVIPTLNEEAAIGAVVGAIPRDVVDEIIVVDSGSTDRTVERARAAGARIIVETRRGYGRACHAGAEAAADCDIIVFLDGDGSRLPGADPAPGRADYRRKRRFRDRIAHPRHSRARQHERATSFLPDTRSAAALGLLYGVRYTDMCPFRAIRREALLRLGMREMSYGWNLEMQMRAVRAGLRILEIPVAHRRRAGGASKVSGNVRGTIKASWRIGADILSGWRWPLGDPAANRNRAGNYAGWRALRHKTVADGVIFPHRRPIFAPLRRFPARKRSAATPPDFPAAPSACHTRRRLSGHRQRDRQSHRRRFTPEDARVDTRRKNCRN